MKIKLFATDVDGVLTDAGMYYTENGDELKKFNTRDGKGIELLRNKGIKTAILTSEDTKIVQARAKKLQINHVYQGVKDKLTVLKKILHEEGLSLNEVAYIGDDINDIETLQAVGLKACPKDAVHKVKKVKGIKILKTKGGEGAVREFCEMILEKHLV